MNAGAFVPIELAEQIFRKNHKVHTIEDLWKIPVGPSNRIIRLFDDPYQNTWTVDDINWAKAWEIYSYRRATQIVLGQWRPNMVNWFDRLRFNMHLKLIQWKVVI